MISSEDPQECLLLGGQFQTKMKAKYWMANGQTPGSRPANNSHHWYPGGIYKKILRNITLQRKLLHLLLPQFPLSSPILQIKSRAIHLFPCACSTILSMARKPQNMNHNQITNSNSHFFFYIQIVSPFGIFQKFCFCSFIVGNIIMSASSVIDNNFIARGSNIFIICFFHLYRQK